MISSCFFAQEKKYIALYINAKTKIVGLEHIKIQPVSAKNDSALVIFKDTIFFTTQHFNSFYSGDDDIQHVELNIKTNPTKNKVTSLKKKNQLKEIHYVKNIVEKESSITLSEQLPQRKKLIAVMASSFLSAITPFKEKKEAIYKEIYHHSNSKDISIEQPKEVNYSKNVKVNFFKIQIYSRPPPYAYVS